MKKLTLYFLLAIVYTLSGCHSVNGVPNRKLQEEAFFSALAKRTPKIELRCSASGISGHGSGVLLGKSGDRVYVVTAEHVLGVFKEDPTCLGWITLKNKKAKFIKVEYTSKKDDVGIASFECKDCMMGQYTKIATEHYIGQQVISIGYQGIDFFDEGPYHYALSISDGVIATNVTEYVNQKKVLKLLRITAQVCRGNSGGGIYNNEGHLIGIVSFGLVYQTKEGPILPLEGQHFIVPYNKVSETIRKSGLVF